MKTAERTVITVEALIKAPVEKVWKLWSHPAHIKEWCQASDDWHAPYADNDLRVDGRFKTTMAAKDGSTSFDFEGTYTNVKHHEMIEYTMDDGRRVEVIFSENGNETKVTESFEAEGTHPVDFQRAGWQAILDNFRKHVESN